MRYMERITSILLGLRNRHFFFIDLFAALVTPALALILRAIDGFDPTIYGNVLLTVTLVFLVIKIPVFFAAGLYKRYWRYASIDELFTISFAWLMAVVLQIIAFFLLRSLGMIELSFPRSIPFIDALLTLPIVGGVRYSVRAVERLHQNQSGQQSSKRVIIVGAGEAGVMIAKEMQKNPQLGLYPVAFIDDDVAKRNNQIRGIRVVGGRQAIPQVVQETGARQVVIAMPSAPGKKIREILSICEEVRVETKTIPGIYELLDGSVRVSQLRDVQIEDLLRRDSVRTDIKAVQELIAGQRVLITGGGGSIGSELCRQVLRCRPAHLVLVGHGENSIFDTYHELRRLNQGGATEIEAVIADIRFDERVQQIFKRHRPQIVFHAAAHKHVPLMELNPSEAITNNVLGTKNLLDAAILTDVERFVMISTDKAVNPTSMMGASKRTAELLVHQTSKTTGRPYVAVRFGNVLGSRGSVVLTFQKQIAAGGPVTVTDFRMERYFMTIPEAVQLVLQAGVLGSGGEVFVLDMGEPVKIKQLAHDLVELSGLEVGRDIDIIETGRRPGEKLFEELFVSGEDYERTRHEKIFIAANASHLVPHTFDKVIDALIASARRGDEAAIRRGLRSLLPEYQPPNGNHAPSPSKQEPAVTAPAPQTVAVRSVR